MAIVQWLVGAALLFLGRKLYWFFVGAVGFVTGLSLAARWLEGRPELVILAVGVALGVLGALLALALQRVALAVAGFLAGGYVGLALLGLIGVDVARLSILPFVLGGVVGAVLVLVLFDWALILLSSLTGAAMIVQSFDIGRALGILLLLLLLAVGIVAQATLLRRERGSQAPSAPPEP
jgi:hypothetical protein